MLLFLILYFFHFLLKSAFAKFLENETEKKFFTFLTAQILLWFKYPIQAFVLF